MDEHSHRIPCTKDNTKSQQGTAPSAANPTMVCAQLLFAVLSSCPLMPPVVVPINPGFQLQVIELERQLASPEFFPFFFVQLSPFHTMVALTCSAAAPKPRRLFLLEKKRRKGTSLDLYPHYGLESHCRLPLLQPANTAIDPKMASGPTGSAGTALQVTNVI